MESRRTRWASTSSKSSPHGTLSTVKSHVRPRVRWRSILDKPGVESRTQAAPPLSGTPKAEALARAAQPSDDDWNASLIQATPDERVLFNQVLTVCPYGMQWRVAPTCSLECLHVPEQGFSILQNSAAVTKDQPGFHAQGTSNWRS